MARPGGQIRDDMNLRRRLSQLHQQIKAERQQDITRAIDFKNHGDTERAQYHTGLADGRNSVIATLRVLTTEYPADLMSTEAL